MAQVPCDGDDVCMKCRIKPPADEILICKTCVTPWHVSCLAARPATLADTVQWECPDCSMTDDPDSDKHVAVSGGSGSSDALVAAIRAIESDQSLTDKEKAVRRQNLMGGKDAAAGKNETIKAVNDVDERFNCSTCLNILDKPVTTPCGHNFCLGCFNKWIGRARPSCAICRSPIPSKMARNPRINSALVIAIRMAKMARPTGASGQPKAYHYIYNQDRPDTAFTTVRAVKSGKANACSGKIFVTSAPDHFGPILAENDPVRNQGVLVGESWKDRMDCRQWGAHLPHVSGIAGQSKHGAQSVALSGGYIDDQDNGEWFLYTGSGGRDLSGNKRTNKKQSSDQVFTKMNLALKVSCLKGYPVRVVRSHKEKRSCYAPEEGVRYDGVYRIEKCWRKKGVQGYLVCRYLFVRCDNEPAPWTSDEQGDRRRPLPVVTELKGIKEKDITETIGKPAWDFDDAQGRWVWTKPPPESKKKHKDIMYLEDGMKIKIVKRKSHSQSLKQQLAKELGCLICRKVMVLPFTTPCAHNFCKGCLEGVFSGQAFVKQRTCEGRRTLRAQKTIMKCPSCTNDISDFLQNPQVNRDLMGMIESLQQKIEEEQSEESSEGAEAVSEDAEENADSELNASQEIDSVEKDEMKVDVDEQGDVSSDLIEAKAKEVDVMKKAPVKRAYRKKKAGDSLEKDEMKVGEDEQVDVSSDLDKAKTKVVGVMKNGPVKRAYRKKKAGDSVEKDEMKVDADEQGDVSSDLVKDKSMVVDVMKKGPVKRAYNRKKAASDADPAAVANGGPNTRKRKAATPTAAAVAV